MDIMAQAGGMRYLMPMNAYQPVVQHDPIRLAVLISGGGTTLANFDHHIRGGTLRAHIPIVIASNDKAAQKVRDRQLDYPIHVVRRRDYDTTQAFSDAIFQLVRQAEVDLVCMAGFLSLLAIPRDYVGRVLNIHPALLPAFGGEGMYGQHVHEAVLARGCKVAGCTVHFASEAYDRGPILLQRCCPVREDDTAATLAARVFEQECIAYPQAIELIAQGKVRIEGEVTRIDATV